MQLTVAEARERIASAAGLCTDDARVIKYLNRSVRRLLNKGKFVGTYARIRVCVTENEITWPRRVQTIESIAVCNFPTKVRNEWFEFLEAGPGLATDSGSCNGMQLVDRGEVVTFADITEDSVLARIRVYSDVIEVAGKYIILQGYDENGNWIRTQFGGAWIDGEKVAISTVVATPAVTTKKFSSLTRVIKDTTNGVIRLYEYDGTSNVRALAYYDPDEKLPSYRRSYLPGAESLYDESGCENSTVTIMAKLRYADVANENDFLLIGNLDALEEETRALKSFDNGNHAEAAISEAMAVRLLTEELSSFQGDGPVIQVRVQTENFGAGSVENAI